MMIVALTVLLGFVPLLNAHVDGETARCSVSQYSGVLYNSDVKSPEFNVSQLFEFGQQLYQLNKRVPDYFTRDLATGLYRYQNLSHKGAQTVLIPPHFVKMISTHLKKILSRNYARSIIFSDLGHGHFMLPSPVVEKLKGMKLSREQSYAYVINHPELKILYHSAERLKKQNQSYERINDKETRHYVDHRNIVGDFSSGAIEVLPSDGSDFNTQRKIPGYQAYWSIDFSWNKGGCVFVDHGESGFYMDLTLSSYQEDPSQVVHSDE